jgi:glycosyltransferase involved in cell wall biosynthesis
MRILQVNTADLGGGAEAVARQLFQAYRSRGHWSRLAVGVKHLEDPDIVAVAPERKRALFSRLARRIGGNRLGRAADDPTGAWARLRGSEDIRAPASWKLLERFGPEPLDILHCHNLHGSSYFDLRALPFLSKKVPLVLTLHDAWLLTGHCAHSLQCDRWRGSCGNCPDLTLYPAIRRDNTAANLARKREVFGHTRAYVSAPSMWLLERARHSHLAASIIEGRVIPNGVDTGLFEPAERNRARAELGLPAATPIVLFVSPGGASNPWKDHATYRAALERMGDTFADPVLSIVLGQSAPTEQVGSIEFRYLPVETEPRRVARIYQAADLYIHATRADTFPLAVLEALACGTPVVASAVGGIPEQVNHLALDRLPVPGPIRAVPVDQATGVLVQAGDAATLRNAIWVLLQNPDLVSRLGANARRDALLRFNRDRQVHEYLAWYTEILSDP